MSALRFHYNEITSEDIEALREVVAESGVFSEEEIQVAVELAEDRLTRDKKSDYHFVLARTPCLPLPLKAEGSGEAAGEGMLAGYTCFGRIPFTAERYDLYWIVVNTHAQRAGIARHLLQESEKIIRTLGGKKLYAETSSRDVYKPAHHFYRKNGFAELACLTGFYADHDDKLTFGKSL